MPSIDGTVVQEDFSLGITRDVAPELIAPNGLYDLINGVLNHDGSTYRRGGTIYKSNAGLGSTGLNWGWDGYFLPGSRTVCANSADFGVLAADDATLVNLGGAGLPTPKQSAQIQDLLFIGGGTIYAGSRKTANYTTGTVSVTNGSKTVTGSGTAWNTSADAGMLFQIGNERVYVVASVDSATQITLRDAYVGTTAAGVSYTLSPVYTITVADPYEAAEFYTVAGGRLLWGIGNRLRFTQLDATTGQSNPHAFDVNDYHDLPEGAQIVGLATVEQTVFIFTTTGTWTLSGITFDIVDANGNPLHRLQILSKEAVLFSAPGIAAWQRSLVVPAIDGIYLIDPVSGPQKISRPIDPLYTYYVQHGWQAGQAWVYRGHYLLPIIDSASQVKDLLVCRLDLPVGVGRRMWVFPWTHFDGDGGEIPAFFARSSTGARTPRLLGAQKRSPSRIVDCSGYFEPNSVNATDADGSVHTFDLITRSFATGGMTKNVVRALRTRYELSGAGNPVLRFDYGSEAAVSSGGSNWDEVNWDAFNWDAGGETGGAFVPLNCQAPVSDGTVPKKCRINDRLRYVRIRVQNLGACSLASVRSLELSIRPSAARRR